MRAPRLAGASQPYVLEIHFLEIHFLEIDFLEIDFLEIDFLEIDFLEIHFLEIRGFHLQVEVPQRDLPPEGGSHEARAISPTSGRRPTADRDPRV